MKKTKQVIGIPGVIETFDKLKELHIRKNQDYTGESPDRFFNFRIASNLARIFKMNDDKVYSTMIGIKLGRLAALLNGKTKPNHESILDSFDDLIVYAAIWKSDVKQRLEFLAQKEKENRNAR